MYSTSKRKSWVVFQWNKNGKLFGEWFATEKEAWDFYQRAKPVAKKIQKPEKRA